MAPRKPASPPEILLQPPNLWETPSGFATKISQQAHADGGERLGYKSQHHKVVFIHWHEVSCSHWDTPNVVYTQFLHLSRGAGVT